MDQCVLQGLGRIRILIIITIVLILAMSIIAILAITMMMIVIAVSAEVLGLRASKSRARLENHCSVWEQVYEESFPKLHESFQHPNMVLRSGFPASTEAAAHPFLQTS